MTSPFPWAKRVFEPVVRKCIPLPSGCCTCPLVIFLNKRQMQSDGQLDSTPSKQISGYSFPITTTTTTTTPPCNQIVGVHTTHKRPAQRKFIRPATAPSADDLLLLPSMPSRQIDGSVSPCPSPDSERQLIHPKSPQEIQLSAHFKLSVDEADSFFSNSSTGALV